MVAAGRDRRPEPHRPRRPDRVDLEVHREAEVVEPPQPGPDRLAVAGDELGLVVQLAPHRLVPGADGLGRVDRRVDVVLGRPWYAREVGEAEGDVLDEDVEVEPALAVGERRVDLARLGVDEVGLDPVAVPPEQRVRERAVAPVDAAAMEVDEQQRHRVEQPVAVRRRHLAEAHQQAPVLQRVAQVLGHEDRVAALGPLREAEGAHRRQARLLEVAQDVVLASRRRRSAAP